jgi:predicted Zn-dependent peptidase
MRRGIIAFAVATVSLAAGARADMPAPTLVPAYERVVLPNGLTVLLLEHHEIPMVHFNVVVRAGSMTDPAGKEGLADLTFSLLRKGTQRYSSEQLADELDYLGATLDGGVRHEAASLQAEFLAKDAGAGLDLLSEVLLRPTFPADEVRKMVDLNVNGIRELKDNPRSVIGRYYDGFLFGAHPFARPVDGTETSLAGLQVEDVKRWYGDFVRPGATILAVAGDFPAADMRRKIEAVFGGWQAGTAAAPPATAPAPAKGKRVLLVDKPDATQTYFRIGNVGVERGNPDAPALEVVNTIFGGRFTSWLSTELRIKSGLSYNAGSTFVERKVPGPFYISSFTRTDDTGKAVDLALEVLERLHRNGPSEDELTSSKNYIRGQYPPEFETAGQLAGAAADLEFYGLDRDTINHFTQKTDAVTLADAKRVIAKRYPRKDLTLVLVGQAAKVRKTAAKYGTLSEKRAADPGY